MKKSFPITENTAVEKLKGLCSKSEKSEYDIKIKLSEWGLEDKAEKIILRLKNDKFIDNNRYARVFAIDKIRFNKWGKYKIRMLLKSKNIPEAQIKAAFDEIDDEEYRNIVFHELMKKRKTLKNSDPYQLKSKIFSFGVQRGYEGELINEFLSLPE